MAVETATYISDLQPSNPAGSDPVADGDNHIRLIKQVLKNTFPNITSPMTASVGQLSGYVPAGAIVLWSGAANAIPAGWALCNGQSVVGTSVPGTLGTPNLQDRFVVGAGAAYNVNANGGSATFSGIAASAGSHAHAGATDVQGNHYHGGNTAATAITEAQLPSHAHTIGFTVTGLGSFPGTGPYQTALVISGPSATSYVGAGQGHSHPIAADGNHAHNLATYEAGTHTHTVTGENRPPYFALCYIMKT